MATKHGPRIYVACLAAYNNGVLHGRWIDADQDEETIREEIQAMLAASPVPGAEEYAIHDYDGFGGLKIDEHESLEVEQVYPSKERRRWKIVEVPA